MKKRYFVLSIIVVFLLGGCQKYSDHFFSYDDTFSSSSYDSGDNLSTHDFFAKDLVIIPKDDVILDYSLESEAALSVDNTNLQVLYSKNAYGQVYPASLTKLATALVALRRGELTDTVTIGYNATHLGDPHAKTCGFVEGDQITLDALLYSMLIYSGNDASIAIAEHLAGSEEQFAKLMNEEAIRVGAVHSSFVNSHGLHDENHYTTPYDIYLIFDELIQYDIFRTIISSSSFTAQYKDSNNNDKEKTFQTTNLYLKGEKDTPEGSQIIGGKTGTTSKAGNCLILLSKDTMDNECISLIMKAKGETMLYSDMTQLLTKVED